jgi:hypothetical protein
MRMSHVVSNPPARNNPGPSNIDRRNGFAVMVFSRRRLWPVGEENKEYCSRRHDNRYPDQQTSHHPLSKSSDSAYGSAMEPRFLHLMAEFPVNCGVEAQQFSLMA